jgi:hypothetical protein
VIVVENPLLPQDKDIIKIKHNAVLENAWVNYVELSLIVSVLYVGKNYIENPIS